jgi:5'-methylthioadenosine phosphorylase
LDTPASEPCIGIIGGTGLGDALARILVDGQVLDVETPFGPPAAPLVSGLIDGARVILLKRHGEGHRFSPTKVPYLANIAAMKMAGCTHVVASGATGSLRRHIEPGSLVLCDQIIDCTVHRTRTFYEHAAVHVDFAEPCCPIMRDWLGRAADTLKDGMVHRTGTYVCMEGPAFSTRAQSHLNRQSGGDLIGMTAMPEAVLAREAELAWALLALPTDFDCWKDTHGGGDVLEHVLANLQSATAAALTLLRAALADTSTLRSTASPAHTALDRAIWTDPACIGDEERQRLAPLWGRALSQLVQS